MFSKSNIIMTPDHRYYDEDIELIPSTSVIEAYKSDKDFVQMAYYKAYWQIFRELKLTKGSAVPAAMVAQRQKEILQQWDDKANKGAGHGDKIHNILWRFNTGQGISTEEGHVVSKVNSTGLFKYSEGSFHEQIIGSKTIGVGGMVDRFDYRSKKDMLIDITDYKTNLTGISMDSIHINERGKVNKMNLYFKNPIGFLEECDYTAYCIQLGIYAYILEVIYGFKIGRLTVLYITIPQDLAELDAYLMTEVQVIPVPYMCPVIKMILEDNTWRMAYEGIRIKKQQRKENSGLKSLPVIKANEVPEAEVINNEEIW